MFTLKLFQDWPNSTKIKVLDAQSFTIHHCHGCIYEITAHRSAPLEDVRFNVGDPTRIPQEHRSAYPSDDLDFYHRAFIENANGKTTESYQPCV